MLQEILQISLPLPFYAGTVNSYLIRTTDGFVLIDTGASNARGRLNSALTAADCKPGQLLLIVLTHGDFDHSGNAAYLRSKYGALIAMHPRDAGIVERGDLFWSRKKPGLIRRIMAPAFPLLFGFGAGERFVPDLFIGEGYNLEPYGLDALVLHLPGHTEGSIGLMTSERDLFCGDLLTNVEYPDFWPFMNDPVAAQESADKLEPYDIRTVFPGHGHPFEMDHFQKWRDRPDMQKAF